MKLDLNSLKEKIMDLIPFGKKEDVEIEEVEAEETPEGEEVEVKTKASEEEDEEEEEEEDEEAAAKKKKGLYIKIAAGIVVAFFAFDEMTKDSGDAPKAPVKKTRAKKKKASKPKKAPKKKVAKKEQVEKPAKKVEAPKPVLQVQPPALVKEPEATVKRDISSVPPTPKQETQELAKEVEKIVEEIGAPTEEELKGPAEYVDPPTYDEVGRGLVYNCKGKHWACVDKNSYFACRDNLKWAKGNGKGFECFTKDVYKNENDCRIIQTNFINTNLKTDFCK